MNFNIQPCINPVPLSVVLSGLTESISKWEESRKEFALDPSLSAEQARYQQTLRYRCECRKAEILRMVTEGISNCPEIAHRLGLGRSTAFIVLDELRKEGRVYTTGNRMNTRWLLVENK